MERNKCFKKVFDGKGVLVQLVNGHICMKETEQLKELEMKCFRWRIRFWLGYGHGEGRKKRAHHSARGAGLNKGTEEENRAYSGSTKQTSLARIYDIYTEVVRISPENLYMLSRDEWQAEESLLNFVERGILQKFSKNRFTWSELDDSVWRVGRRAVQSYGAHNYDTFELDYDKAGHFHLNLNWCPWLLCFLLPIHVYTCLSHVCCLKIRLFSEKWFLYILGPFHNKQRCQKFPG